MDLRCCSYDGVIYHDDFSSFKPPDRNAQDPNVHFFVEEQRKGGRRKEYSFRRGTVPIASASASEVDWTPRRYQKGKATYRQEIRREGKAKEKTNQAKIKREGEKKDGRRQSSGKERNRVL